MIDNQKMSIILPARIVEFFPTTQTATIQISIETVFSYANSISDSKARKPLEGVPVHTVSGGGWAMTMPIKEGDTCLMYFSQQGYDHWLYEDKDEAGLLANLPKPWLRRQFSDDDGLALVGFNTLPRAIQNFSANHSQWRNEDAAQVISLNEDTSIEITSPVKLTINAPSVEVNCETADINASTKTTVTCPDSEFTGNVTVGGTLDVALATTLASTLSVVGSITGTGGLAVSGGSGATVSGDMAVTGGNLSTDQDVIAGTTSLTGHTHLDAEGRPTAPPT